MISTSDICDAIKHFNSIGINPSIGEIQSYIAKAKGIETFDCDIADAIDIAKQADAIYEKNGHYYINPNFPER